MKYALLTLLLVISTDPREISKVNQLKKEAEKAFKAGEYESAIDKYYALDTLDLAEDDAIKLNLAHAYYQNGDTALAKVEYDAIKESTNKKLKSIAYQQDGVMLKNENKLEAALASLKQSLRNDPTNEEARYNYEVVKKLLEEQEKQEQQDQNNEDQEKENEEQNEENQDQQDKGDNKENQEGDKEEQEEKSEQESEEEQEGKKEEGENEDGEEKEQEEQKEPTEEEMTKEKLEQMNMSEEKAQMILEAMRNNEIQYLQQQKRKPTKRPKSDKPDW